MSIVPHSHLERYAQAKADYRAALTAADDAWNDYYSIVDEPYNPDVASRDYAEHHQKAAHYLNRAHRADEHQKAAYKFMGHCYKLVGAAPSVSYQHNSMVLQSCDNVRG